MNFVRLQINKRTADHRKIKDSFFSIFKLSKQAIKTEQVCVPLVFTVCVIFHLKKINASKLKLNNLEKGINNQRRAIAASKLLSDCWAFEELSKSFSWIRLLPLKNNNTFSVILLKGVYVLRTYSNFQRNCGTVAWQQPLWWHWFVQIGPQSVQVVLALQFQKKASFILSLLLCGLSLLWCPIIIYWTWP